MDKHPTPVFAGPTPASLYEPLTEHEVAALRPAPGFGQWLANLIRGYRGSSTNSAISRDVRAR